MIRNHLLNCSQLNVFTLRKGITFLKIAQHIFLQFGCWYSLTATFVLTCFVGTAAASDNNPNAGVSNVIEIKTLQISTRVDLPPYVDGQNQSGIELDIIKAIFEGTAFRPQFVQLPRIRMISAFENGAVQGMLTQNVKSSDVGCATDVYIEHENVALTIADRELQFSSLNSLAGRAVVSFSGATTYIGHHFRDAVAKAALYTETTDQAGHIALLYKGRFDVIVGDRLLLQLAHQKHFTQTGQHRPLAIHSILPVSPYIARFHEQEVCDIFNAGLDKLRDEGRYQKIWAGYQSRLEFATVDP